MSLDHFLVYSSVVFGTFAMLCSRHTSLFSVTWQTGTYRAGALLVASLLDRDLMYVTEPFVLLFPYLF